MDNFVLDTEVVTVGTPSYQLVFAFDILDIQSETNREYQRYRGYGSGSYIQRHELLREIVEKISASGIFVKPIVPANESYNMWKDHWNNLPYKTDGLIFTPVFYTHPILKWKPSNELTIHVAIGGPLERDQTHTRFQAYIYDDGKYPCFVPPKNIVDSVQGGHWGFHTDSWDDDILDIDRQDRIAIANDRMDESNEWLKEKSCILESCCCGEKLPLANRKIMHCSKCGILGVADAELDFVCKSACCPDQSIFGVTDINNAVSRCTVMVPNDCAELAKHGIVEVIPRFVDDGGNFGLSFKRVRIDLQRANTFRVAKEILHLSRRNVSMKDVQFKNSALICEMNVEQFQFKDESMSRLHAAAILKEQNMHYLVQQLDAHLVDPVFPPLLEELFLAYLPIPDLVRFRKISKLWKHTIDEVEILRNTKNAYFSRPDKIAQYNKVAESYMMKDSSSTMNASALAQYYKFGGSACEVNDSSDDYSNESGYYSDDYNDLNDTYENFDYDDDDDISYSRLWLC
jgi:hypothetical protein